MVVVLAVSKLMSPSNLELKSLMIDSLNLRSGLNQFATILTGMGDDQQQILEKAIKGDIRRICATSKYTPNLGKNH